MQAGSMCLVAFLKAIHTVAIEPEAIIVFSCTIDPVIRPLGLQAVI